MALRDKVRTRALPLLQPGDEIRHVFLAQSGMSPYSPIGGLLGALLGKYWIVVVTEDKFVVMKASMWMPTKPKSVAFAEPRRPLSLDGKLWASMIRHLPTASSTPCVAAPRAAWWGS